MAELKKMMNKVYTHAGNGADQPKQSLQDQSVTEPGPKAGKALDKNYNIHNPGNGGPKAGASKVSPDRNRRTALLDIGKSK